mgnify:FL=1
MNYELLMLSILQSLLLAMGQVMMKFGLMRMEPFVWNAKFWHSFFVNWQFALCGISFGAAGLLWMYIVKHYPLSQAYPLVSLSYVFGMVAAVLFFHEQVDITKWLGVIMIMGGCALIIR